jgi:hypothetical protein
MISKVDVQAWAAADLTGNAALVKVGTDLYVAGGTRSDSTQAIYKSVDFGLNWTVVAQLPAPAGTLDPAIVADGTNIHIVHSQPNYTNPLLTDVFYYVFDTVSVTLGPAIPLLTGSKAQSAYDIVPMPAGAALVVTAGQEIITPVGHEAKYVLLAFHITAMGVTSEVIQETHWSTGETCGAVSLVATGGSAPVELYYTEHPRVFAFRDVSVKINLRTFTTVWSGATLLRTYGARFTDDKLTVIAAPNGDRLLSQAYHLQSKTYGMQTQILYGWGVFSAGVGNGTWAWTFGELAADGYNIFKEPVIGTDGVGNYLAYLICPRDQTTKLYAREGFLRVANITPGDLSLVARVGAWASLRFKWLRGGKLTQDTQSKWALVGIEGDPANEMGGGPGTYLSEFNLAPRAVLKPTTLTVKRGVDYILDASETIDPDLDSLTYTWSSSSADAAIHLTPFEGSKKAVLRVDKAIGPLEVSFTVSVAVDDLVPGHAALPQTHASSVITVPFNAEPTISVASPVAVLRNSRVDIHANIADADLDTLVILWQQLTGTPVTLTNADRATVSVDAYRMHPDGEVVTLRVSADDGVNRVVTSDVVLNVTPIIDRDLDAGHMARAFYMDTTAQPPLSWHLVAVLRPVMGDFSLGDPQVYLDAPDNLFLDYTKQQIVVDIQVVYDAGIPVAPSGYTWALSDPTRWNWASGTNWVSYDPLHSPRLPPSSSDASWGVAFVDYGPGSLTVGATVNGVTKTVTVAFHHEGP